MFVIILRESADLVILRWEPPVLVFVLLVHISVTGLGDLSMYKNLYNAFIL